MPVGRRQLLGSEYFGRTAQSTPVDAKTQRALELPPSFRLAGKKSGVDTEEKQTDLLEAEEDSPRNHLRVEHVDFLVSSNTTLHQTSEYEITQPGQEDSPAQLVIRRGKPFQVQLTLNREYDEQIDSISVILETGEAPRLSKRTQQKLVPQAELRTMLWSCSLHSLTETTMVLNVQAGCDAIIGKWKFLVETTTEPTDDEETTTIHRHEHGHPVYVLFNPFCKHDQVYMEDEIWRDECICNESGKIYTGNWCQIGHRPWNYGQFEGCTLDCALLLLDLVKLQDVSRSNPVAVVRAISTIINSRDNDGVMVGNWSGRYEGATAPTAWIGSYGILKQFYETRHPVKYGHCWTFAALMTTVCRALGIPARCVTNFSSAHDCDGSACVDQHWDFTGRAINDLNTDSVWSFHVWNEVWMTRPDIPGSYGGWQVVDVTPQETSNGIKCAGPMPVAAIKEGNIQLGCDGPLVFSELNADKVHWYHTDDDEWEVTIEKNKVGRHISTQRARNLPDETDEESWKKHLFNSGFQHDDTERLDLTQTYKFKHGSEEQRAAVLKANTLSVKHNGYNQSTEDVQYMWSHCDAVVGSNFDVVLMLQNTCRKTRTVRGVLSLRSCFYTGVVKAHVKKLRFRRSLGPVRGDTVVMHLTPEEYEHLMTDQYGFKLECVSWVKETNHVYTRDEDFRLRRPDLQIDIRDNCNVDEDTECTVRLTNPMGITLTQCGWRLEGPGIQKPVRKECSDIEPYSTAEMKVVIRPWKSGKRQLLASFDSKQLTDVTGSKFLHVEDED